MVRKQLAKVLLVEDNEIDIMALKRAFRRNNVENPIEVAHDGIEALEILRGNQADRSLRQPYVILLDLNMPRMGGMEFLEALREDAPLRCSIVFVLTTSEAQEDIHAAYDRQIAAYLSKNDARGDFSNVLELLEQFQNNVYFPPAWN